MKIKMINQCGNVVVYATSEREKERLLQRGFHIEEKPASKPAPKKRKAGKKHEGQAEN